MRKARLATVIDGANIRPAIASPFSRRTARNLPAFLWPYTVDRQPGHGLLDLAGTIPPVHRSAESACIREAGAPHCRRFAGAHRGEDHGSLTCAAQSFLGRTQAIWTCARRHSVIRCCSTAIWPSHSHPKLESIIVR